jgi:quercetin dioxygenase-like cupin family protein
MNTIYKPLTTAMLLAAALAACSQTPAEQSSATDESASSAAETETSAANAQPSREPPLLEGKLDGISTAEGAAVDSVMYIANFPPGSVSSHHSHPGWEYNYILEGEVTFEVKGQEPFTKKAGEGMYNPRGNSHIVRNASQTEPAKLVSVLVKDEGAPVAVDVPSEG